MKKIDKAPAKDKEVIENLCKQCGGQMEITTIGDMQDKIMQCSYCDYTIDIADSFYTKESNKTGSYIDADGNTVNQTSTTVKYRIDGPLGDKSELLDNDFLKGSLSDFDTLDTSKSMHADMLNFLQENNIKGFDSLLSGELDPATKTDGNFHTAKSYVTKTESRKVIINNNLANDSQPNYKEPLNYFALILILMTLMAFVLAFAGILNYFT